MTSLRRSAILPATPVQSSGMRTLKSPFLTSERTLSRTASSSLSAFPGSEAPIVPTSVGIPARVPKSRTRGERAAREREGERKLYQKNVLPLTESQPLHLLVPRRGSRRSAARTRRGACAGRRCGRRRGPPSSSHAARRRRAGRAARPWAPRARGRRPRAAPGGARWRASSRSASGDGSMPEIARTDWIWSSVIARSSGPACMARCASCGRAAPSATTAARRRSWEAASRTTSPPSERPKPAIRSGSTSGRRSR